MLSFSKIEGDGSSKYKWIHCLSILIALVEITSSSMHQYRAEPHTTSSFPTFANQLLPTN